MMMMMMMMKKIHGIFYSVKLYIDFIMETETIKWMCLNLPLDKQ